MCQDTPPPPCGAIIPPDLAKRPEPKADLAAMHPDMIRKRVARLPDLARRLRKRARQLERKGVENQHILNMYQADARACDAVYALVRKLQDDFETLSRAARGEVGP